MSLNSAIKNASILASGLSAVPKNVPRQYEDRQPQYYEKETVAFVHKVAQYASDFYAAEIQGLDLDCFEDWQTELIRLADLSSSATTSQRIADDIKCVLFANPEIGYVPRGAKIQVAGSTWLVTNPLNISSAVTETVAERCTTTWNHLDYYGNILMEPLVIEKGIARAANNNIQEFMALTEGYYTVRAQYNKYTALLRQNTRMILGSGAYAVRGFTDFIQEFTGDDRSRHFCEFYLYYEEPNEAIDDLENRVAGGLTFSWDIQLAGQPIMTAGQSMTLTPTSTRNGEVVTSTPEYPIGYTWISSDPEVATVNSAGQVTAAAAGNCEITCMLNQNPAITASWSLRVETAQSGPSIQFAETPPAEITAYASDTLTVICFMDGATTTDTATWSFSGADAGAYSASITGNTVQISCWGPAETPLTITAAYGDASVSATILLLGV